MAFLRKITSNYNCRLLHPQGNLTTEEDCVELAPVDFVDFCNDFPVKSLNKSISETQKGNKLGEKKPKNLKASLIASVVMKIK